MSTLIFTQNNVDFKSPYYIYRSLYMYAYSKHVKLSILAMSTLIFSQNNVDLNIHLRKFIDPYLVLDKSILSM